MISRGMQALRAWGLRGEVPLVYLCDDEGQAEALAATLRALTGDDAVIFMPSSDQLPSDDAPASPANVGARLAALSRLRSSAQAGEATILVTSGEAAARRYPAPNTFDRQPPRLTIGDAIEDESFRALVAQLGYIEDDIVDEAGEVCFRGAVIDIFPADAGEPVRLELVEDKISAIDHFDPASQLRTGSLEAITIGRASEPADEHNACLLDHVPAGTIIFSRKAEARRTRFLALAREAAGSGSKLDAIEDTVWQEALADWKVESEDEQPIEAVPRFVEARRPAQALRKFLTEAETRGVSRVLMGSARDLRFLGAGLRREAKLDLVTLGSLSDAGALTERQVGSLEGPLDAGAISPTIALISAADILGSRAEIESADTSNGLGGALDFLAVEPGDIVIHEDHGVAELLGLTPDPAGGGGEVIVLEYAREGRRLVATSEASKIWRYGGEVDAVSLDTLNGSSWEKRKAAVAEAIALTARELVAMAAARETLTAPVIEPDPAAYERFAARFSFSETRDQAKAIEAVRVDLASGCPMERLIIGDVGYGKTEVALRAAAMAALAGHQVAVAAPTTVLAQQHLREFTRRFADTGVTVAGLFGSTPAAEKRKLAKQIAAGEIDIVVGTAAVAGKAIHYAKLGLVIIDEEQRFGAADKQKLRGHPDKHLLVMSATPIPRTLHRSLVGLQAMSLIATPPARRQPVRTALKSELDDSIATALKREKLRRGQSFVVVPRISDLDALAERLAKLVPDQTVVRAHGKLPAAELDQVMVDFADGKGDILLATNIIEAGLNIPRANTMIVWNADRFGLAQLHQLRGRVGRGRRRGSVILISPGDTLTKRSRKRLETLAQHGQLGAGFAIAAADLDQRGGGDVLSEAQSGHMKLIGVELYQHLLEDALRAARGLPPRPREIELKLAEAGSIPEEWIPDAAVRLNLHLRLSRLTEPRDLDAFADELADRFGDLPSEVEALLDGRLLTLMAREAGVESLTLGPGGCAVTFAGEPAATFTRAGFAASKDRWVLKAQNGSSLDARSVTRALEAA